MTVLWDFRITVIASLYSFIYFCQIMRLTHTQRIEIAIFRQEGYSYASLAQRYQVRKATIIALVKKPLIQWIICQELEDHDPQVNVKTEGWCVWHDKLHQWVAEVWLNSGMI